MVIVVQICNGLLGCKKWTGTEKYLSNLLFTIEEDLYKRCSICSTLHFADSCSSRASL